MREILNIVPKSLSKKLLLQRMLWLWIGLLLAMGGVIFEASAPLTIGVIVILVWCYIMFFVKVEYEYTYFNPDITIAKITNKSRRKVLVSVEMKDVVIIAPAGHQALHNSEQASGTVKRRNYTSRRDGIREYKLVYRKGTEVCIVSFEPDDEFLNGISQQYPRFVEKGE